MCKVYAAALFLFASLVIDVESAASVVKRDVDFAKLNKFNDDLMMMSKLGGDLNFQSGQRRSEQPDNNSGLSGRSASFGSSPAPAVNPPAPVLPIHAHAGNLSTPVAPQAAPTAVSTPGSGVTPPTPTPLCSHPKDLKCKKNATVTDALHASAIALGFIK